MDEVMMVPVNELKQLENYYKGQITESALLNKAGRLAAEQQLIFNDKSIPPSVAVSMTKPLVNEQTKLVKRVRSGTTTPAIYRGTEEPEGPTAAGPLENLLKQLIKKKEPGTPEIKEEPVTPKIKKEPVTPKIKKEPVTPKIKKEPVTLKKERKKTISTRAPRPKSSKKGTLRKVFEGVASEVVKSLEKPKRKRRRKTEAEKLGPSQGWESWYPQGDLRGRLEYDED